VGSTEFKPQSWRKDRKKERETQRERQQAGICSYVVAEANTLLLLTPTLKVIKNEA
jgi:hypothetical protein